MAYVVGNRYVCIFIAEYRCDDKAVAADTEAVERAKRETVIATYYCW